MKPKQRIMIGTEITWERGRAVDSLFEHATQRLTVDDASMDAEADNPARVVVHDHKHSMRS